ncbi:hypothetical protein [Psychromonas aquimarina]|uniref:hypothetical protein n=1 Tax=Psychromonas aquimarina TaxID=444919 RepID=UPI000491B595|nr:hypothetical protein [Psychromonas aquimarina]
MRVFYHYMVITAMTLLYASSSTAADLRAYVNQYFQGKALEYGFGSGTSSNNPRVVAVTHYCTSGYYYSIGQSCRPNIIARGYQCSPYRDDGNWSLKVQGQQATLFWTSTTYGPGNFPIYVRNDGVFVDPRGNAFIYAGEAQCY